MLRNGLLRQDLFVNAIAFMKVRVPDAELRAENVQFDLLDQTRIHPEAQNYAVNIAKDALHPVDGGAEGRVPDRSLLLREIFANPRVLDSLDMNKYESELQKS